MESVQVGLRSNFIGSVSGRGFLSFFLFLLIYAGFGLEVIRVNLGQVQILGPEKISTLQILSWNRPLPNGREVSLW